MESDTSPIGSKMAAEPPQSCCCCCCCSYSYFTLVNEVPGALRKAAWTFDFVYSTLAFSATIFMFDLRLPHSFWSKLPSRVCLCLARSTQSTPSLTFTHQPASCPPGTPAPRVSDPSTSTPLILHPKRHQHLQYKEVRQCANKSPDGSSLL